MTTRIEVEGWALVVTLDRPEKKNAIDKATAEAIARAAREASNHKSVRGLVLTAAGDTFSAGGDLEELARLPTDTAGAKAVLDAFDALSALETCDVPVVAAVQGDAMGGGAELLMLTDLVIVEAQARITFRHARMGLTPAWGGLSRLVERVGPIEAARLLFTASPADAESARRIGLVNEIAPTGRARERALALVEEIAKNPRETVAAHKRALIETRAVQRGRARDIERAAFEGRWGSPEHAAAMRAFAERRVRP